MTKKSLVFIATHRGDGSTKEVNEEYVRAALSGHYRSLDLAVKCIVDGISARTPFEIFSVKHSPN